MARSMPWARTGKPTYSRRRRSSTCWVRARSASRSARRPPWQTAASTFAGEHTCSASRRSKSRSANPKSLLSRLWNENHSVQRPSSACSCPRRPFMRRVSLVAGMVALAAATALLVVQPGTSAARNEEKAKESGKSPTAGLLPIGQVVLFSSGVGYFQREGTIDGDSRVDLTFPATDINDLIKSMTLRDLDGGHISAVSYDGNVPVERTLRSFAVDLTGNPTFSSILNQARGEKVEVVLQQGAAQPGNLTGSVIGVEHKKVQVNKDIVEVECLNLWCADGMRSVKLSEVQRLRFLNAVMDSEFKKALETLSLGHDTQKKSVSIQFSGEGKRRVKVGYVVENPIWKTSYRLVLAKHNGKDDKKETKQDKEDKPYLQGWAVVENTTDEDWSGVRMALISGRPISFQMNLYDALFIKRPVVEPELFASLRPPTYSGGLGMAGGPAA